VGQYNQNDTTETRFGSIAELTNLTAVLVRSNLVPVVDVVMNHMRQPPNEGGKQFTNYPHGIFFKTTNDFHATPLGHNDTLAPYHQTTDFGSDYYDIAHLSANMRSGLKRWGAWLVTNAVYGGFRFDLTQKIEPWYVYEWLSFPEQRGRFGSAEYWRLAGVRELQEWSSLIGGKAAIWDWKCRDLLYEMCYTNAYNFDISQLTNTLVWQSPHQALAHTENHDTYCPGKLGEPEITRRGIVRQKQLAYSFTVFGEAMPTVYWLDYYDTPYHNGTTNPTQVHLGYSGTPLKPEIDRLMWIRRQYLAVSQSYLVTNPALKADLFISLRDGGGTKSGGLLALNDSESTALQEQVQPPWISAVLEDKIPLTGGASVTTDVNGVVWIGATQRSCRIFVPVN
jgi:alpha-amylase